MAARRYAPQIPHTEARSQTNQTVAATRIWPRGREELSRQTRQPRVAEPKNVQPRRFAPGRQVASDRPVLREVLKDKLDERMVNLMEEAMKWP
ncbi:hypothetical protein [Bradyrhizobium japonicum]|uniref:hypothetical protein n=1 Tax=Bradyrhizobium japonicum TaxID=375 RepID=UPI00209E18F0|nr:hypothetical protein [Bradyrhizobium japonicum]MCP1778821.1 hypothetical protein [Bradyrhizobium japonicum]MCP1958181.1 hypothetical protein [Bradyrhizobium japonicum]